MEMFNRGLIFLFIIVTTNSVRLFCDAVFIEELQTDYKAETKFNYRYRYKGVYTEEDHVSWRIETALQTIHIRRMSHIYVNDSSIIQIGLRFDHLQNIKVGVYSGTKRLLWKFFYVKDHMVLISDQRIRDQIWIEVNGTQNYHPMSSYQVSYINNEKTRKREYYAFTSMYPYRASEFFPGVMHNRLTSLSLNITMMDKKYKIFTPNNIHNGEPTNIALDSVGFVILRAYNSYNITKFVRLIVHKLSNTEAAPMQVYPLINATRMALDHLTRRFNTTIRELITMVILPSVSVRPMGFVRDICILDAGIAESSEKVILMYVMKCFLQQSIIRALGTKDESTQRLMKGIRDYFAISYMSSKWWHFDAEDYVAQRGILLEDEQKVATKYRWIDHNKEDVKVVAFMDIVRAQYKKNVTKFNELIWSFFKFSFDINPTRQCKCPTDNKTRIIGHKTGEGGEENEEEKEEEEEEEEKDCSKTLEFVDIVETFKKSETDINYSDDVPMDKFLTGWLKEDGYPIIKTRVANNSKTGTASIHFVGLTTSKTTQLYFPIQLWVKSRVNRSMSSGLDVFYKIVKEDLNDTFWFETNEVEVMRNYEKFIWENRTLYYYLTINGTSMFRIFYRDENWKELLKYFGELPEWVKARFVSDVHYFHRTQDLTWRLAFRVVHRLRFETSAKVWLAAEKMIIDMEKLFRFSPFELDYWRIMISVVKKFYDSGQRRNPLAVKLACFVQMEVCHLEAINMTKAIIADGADFHRFEDILCAGMRKMDDDYFLHLVNLVKGFTYKYRYSLMIALTCRQDYVRLYGILHSTFVAQTIVAPVQVKLMMLTNMYLASSIGSTVVLTFLRNYHGIVVKLIGKQDLERLIMIMCEYLRRRLEYRQMKEVMLLMGINPTQGLEKIKNQMIWMKRNFEKMKGFMRTIRKLKRVMY